jgi:hypothetical protein
MSVTAYQSIRHNIPTDLNFRYCHYETASLIRMILFHGMSCVPEVISL